MKNNWEFSKKLHFPTVRAIPMKDVPWYKRFVSSLLHLREWEIMEDYIIWSEYLQAYLFIPKGFIYDGASVPKILHSIYSSIGVLFLGSGPHDLGYRYGGLLLIDTSGVLTFREYTKKELDRVFHHLCILENHLVAVSTIATSVLHVFGWFTWNSYRQKGLDIYKDFPDLLIV